MSSITVDSLKLIANQSNIYGGFFVFSIGVIGNILNIIVFTSLNTFRETSTVFYMIVASAVDIFQLVVGLLSRILITGYNIDPSATSSFICKARQFTSITTLLISFTLKCFVVIDQYLSLTNRWGHLCNRRTASRLVISSFVLWFLHGILWWVFQDVYPIVSTNQTTCSIANPSFMLYMSRFISPVLLGFLPLIIRISFGLLAFVSVRSLHKRRVPIVRLEREKQLTAMVLVVVLNDVLFTLPYIIYVVIYSNVVTFTNPISIAQNALIIAITRVIFYEAFASSFYIYFCVSSRFRKQLKYVLVDIHFEYWRVKINRYKENQVAPQLVVDGNAISTNNPVAN